MQTTPTKQSDIQRKWHLIDANGAVIGRIATRIATLLRGKTKSHFVHHLDCGDYVVVINAAKITATGKKELQKKYTNYSGYPGGLKTYTLAMMRNRNPNEIIKRAVSGMLPKNKLRDQWLTRLYIYADEKHPYEKQVQS